MKQPGPHRFPPSCAPSLPQTPTVVPPGNTQPSRSRSSLDCGGGRRHHSNRRRSSRHHPPSCRRGDNRVRVILALPCARSSLGARCRTRARIRMMRLPPLPLSSERRRRRQGWRRVRRWPPSSSSWPMPPKKKKTTRTGAAPPASAFVRLPRVVTHPHPACAASDRCAQSRQDRQGAFFPNL